MLKAHPLSLKSNTSLVIVSPFSGSNTNFNFPGPGTTKSVATDFVVPGPGKLKLVFEPENGETITKDVFDFKDKGCALSMYNLEESIEGFARACFNYGLNLGWPS